MEEVLEFPEIESENNLQSAEEVIRQLIWRIGDDPNREGLQKTPERVVRSWQELFRGYKEDPRDILTADFCGENYDEMVLLKDIDFYSTCEHHCLPFVGVAHVAYIPNQRVIGISKLARVVDCFSRRLQIQERLTIQIASTLESHLTPRGVAVSIEAKHHCMMCRGVRKQSSVLITSHLIGAFKEDAATRAEFFSRLRS